VNNFFRIFISFLFINACNILGGSKNENLDKLFVGEIGNFLLRPQIKVNADLDVSRPVSSRNISFTFSEPIITNQFQNHVSVSKNQNSVEDEVNWEQMDNFKISISFRDTAIAATYKIDFTKLATLVGKSIYPESIDVVFDPSAPTLTSVYGNILDTSFFNSGYLDLLFNESVNGAELLDNYSISGTATGNLRLSSVTRIRSNNYRLFYTGLPSSSGGILKISVTNIKDTAGNLIHSSVLQFQVYGFKQSGNLITARSGASVVILRTGEILIAGGVTATGVTNTAEIYNPETKLTRSVGNLITARRRHTATLLQDGKVFFAGGDKNTTQSATDAINNTEIFDPSTEMFSNGPFLSRARMDHSAILLSNGKVLIAGGIEVENSSPFLSTSTTEIFNPVTNTLANGNNMNFERRDFVLQRLSDGKVYLFGGLKKLLSDEYIYKTEIFDETLESFSISTNYDLIFGRSSFFVRELSNGKIFVFGGGNTSEIYIPTVGSFGTATSFSLPRSKFGSITFSEGKTVLFGGEADGSYVPKIDYYDPNANRFTLGNRLLFPRIDVTGVILPNGKVYLIGGSSASFISQIEEYSYE